MTVVNATTSNNVASVFMGLNPPGGTLAPRFRSGSEPWDKFRKRNGRGTWKHSNDFGAAAGGGGLHPPLLSAIPNGYGRLIYVSSLRESDDRYRHDGFGVDVSENAVQLALEHCTRIVRANSGTPLSQQEWDLRMSLAALEGGIGTNLARWRNRDRYEELEPRGVPVYLYDLFASNLRLLLELIEGELTVRSAA